MINYKSNNDRFTVTVDWEKAFQKYSRLIDNEFISINNVMLLDQIIVKEIVILLKDKLKEHTAGITILLKNKHDRRIVISLAIDTLDSGKLIYSTLYK